MATKRKTKKKGGSKTCSRVKGHKRSNAKKKIGTYARKKKQLWQTHT